MDTAWLSKGQRIFTLLLFFPESPASALTDPSSTPKGYDQGSVTLGRGGGLEWEVLRYQGQNMMRVDPFPSPLRQDGVDQFIRATEAMTLMLRSNNGTGKPTQPPGLFRQEPAEPGRRFQCPAENSESYEV